MTEQATAGPGTSREAAGQRSVFGIRLPARKPRTRDIVALTRELATLLEAGVSVVPALELLREQRAGTSLEPVIAELVQDLNAGRQLAEAMSKHPVFGRAYVRTIAASDRGAPLVRSLMQAADFLDTADSAIAQAKRAMIYPMMVLTIGIAVTLLMITTALPPMIGLLENLDSDLPLPTRVLMALSEALVSYKSQLLLGLMAIALGVYRYVKSERGQMAIHRALLRLPVVSTVVVHSDIARASAAMGALTEAGLPLPEAVEVAKETVSNRVIRDALEKARQGLLAGEGLAQPLADTGVLPKTFTQTLRVAEETGTLDQNLKRMAEYYQKESTESVKSLVGLIEPLSTIAVALLVGFIAMAVIMPMYSALGSLK